ncbi:hypothetical protein TruAng_005558 [Truncatella angustata]|nr:hypothetical protein TruAng_005558 [Truncatella angustata]
MSSSPNNAATNEDLLQDSISDVTQAAKIPAKRRGASIKATVETLASECYDKGVLPDALKELVDLIITPSHLDQASLNNILRNLYPATQIDPEIVINVIGCLGHGALKPSLPIQGALLKWLIMVHHIVGEQGVLPKLYAVLFNLLDTAAIRHVRPYRIQAVLALSRQTGNDPALTGLLRVFKNYYPEIIVGDATRGKASAFKHPDPQWRQRLDEIQQRHVQSLQERNQPRDAFRVTRRLGNSHGKVNAIPDVHTSHAHEDSITLEEIETVDGLVSNLEKIELPNQLISVLADPLLQKLMLMKPDSASEERISNWLMSYADEISRDEATSLAELTGFLETLQDYASTTKNLPSAVLSFFVSYLNVWDGKQARQYVLHILSYATLPEHSFSDLYESIFATLERKVLDGSADSQLDVLGCYIALLQHWTTSLISQRSFRISSTAAISELISHANKLCLTVAQTSSCTPTHSVVLDFYEAVAYIASHTILRKSVRIVIPPSALVYILHFSSSPTTTSRLCGVLSRYKQGFQAAMASSRSDYTTAYINEFNGFLMDVCNCLWRSRAFNFKDANAHACLMTKDITDDLTSYVSGLRKGSNLTSLFTISASPVLGLLATSYLRELEDVEMEQGSSGLDTRHAGPVTKASLNTLSKNGGVSLTWDEYRLGVLSYLEQNGMEGVGRLMHGTMTTLMKRT